MTSYAIIREDNSIEHSFTVNSATPEIEALKHLFDTVPFIMMGKAEVFTLVEMGKLSDGGNHPGISSKVIGKISAELRQIGRASCRERV